MLYKHHGRRMFAADRCSDSGGYSLSGAHCHSRPGRTYNAGTNSHTGPDAYHRSDSHRNAGTYRDTDSDSYRYSGAYCYAGADTYRYSGAYRHTGPDSYHSSESHCHTGSDKEAHQGTGNLRSKRHYKKPSEIFRILLCHCRCGNRRDVTLL